MKHEIVNLFLESSYLLNYYLVVRALKGVTSKQKQLSIEVAPESSFVGSEYPYLFEEARKDVVRLRAPIAIFDSVAGLADSSFPDAFY